MGAYQKWLRRHVIFDVPLTTRQREIYLFMLNHIINEYQKHSEKFCFEDVEYIRITAAPQDEGIAGLATRRHVKIAYYGLPAVDSLLAAHELLHAFFFNLLGSSKEARYDAVNMVHYASNVAGWYISEKNVTYLSYRDRFMRRKAVRLRLFYFNVGQILKDKGEIKALIRRGVAPEGQHQYSQY